MRDGISVDQTVGDHKSRGMNANGFTLGGEQSVT